MFAKESIKKVMDMASACYAVLSEKSVDEIKLCISDGNRKIGRVMNVSLMPGRTCHNCSECINYCYDIKACLQYSKTVIDARMRNTVLVEKDRDEFFRRIEDKISRRRKNKFFRWHVAGDILDIDYFNRMVGIARRHDDFVFWTYTKYYTVVNSWIDEHGKLPENLHVMFSEWDGMPLVNPHDMPVFTCKMKAGNKNHPVEYFAKLHKCPGNCDICKAAGRGCVVGETTYADEH